MGALLLLFLAVLFSVCFFIGGTVIFMWLFPVLCWYIAGFLFVICFGLLAFICIILLK